MGWRALLGGNGCRGRVVRTRMKELGSGAGPGAGCDWDGAGFGVVDMVQVSWVGSQFERIGLDSE